MTGRRVASALLLLGLAPVPAATAQDFPPVAEAAGRRLVLNGVGARRYLGFEVYRAALYLERPSADAAAILASPGLKLIRVRYARDVGLDAVAAAWEEAFAAACGGGACPVPEPLRRWLRPVAAGDEETYLFLPDAAELSANGAAPVRVPGAAASRTLLATWIGPRPPTAALKRGLLGGG